jgi:hypothetical protein
MTVMKLAITFSLFAVSMFAAEWTGTISDAKCGMKHSDASEASAKCVQGCVKGGQAAVFVTGDKVIKIANQDAVKEHLGHKVTVTGKLDGDTLTVDSVKMGS